MQWSSPQLWDALLKHPSITDNQLLHCTLLASTRALRAAVTAQCSGRLTVQLAVAGRQKQKVLQLAAWLQQHAMLVGRIELQLSRFEREEYKKMLGEEQCPWSDELQAVAAGLMQADSQQGRGYLRLQHLSLEGEPVPSELLDVLPARSLTSLRCELQSVLDTSDLDKTTWSADAWYRSTKAISKLPELRELDISSSGTYGKAGPDALKDLTSLQHLTKLQLGAASVYQLQYLPPHVKELQVAITIHADQDARGLAPWLQKHARLLTHLTIAADVPQSSSYGLVLSFETWQVLVEALRDAASAAGGQLQLQHLTVHGMQSSREFFQQVADSCNLLSLAYPFDNPKEAREAPYGAICSMTTLRELSVLSQGVYADFHRLGVDALQRLSAITGLTRLYMNVIVSQAQLEHVPDSVRHLAFDSYGVWGDNGYPAFFPWSLGHLNNLTRLEIPYLVDGHRFDSDRAVLPPNLVALKLRMKSASLEPLTCLRSLQELQLCDRYKDAIMPSEQLLSLTCLSSLTNLSLILACGRYKQPRTSHVQAWASLPLRSLTITDEEKSLKVPKPVIVGLTRLHSLTRLELSCTLQRDALLQALPLCTRLQLLKLNGILLRGTSLNEPDSEDGASLFTESDSQSTEGDVDSDKGVDEGADIGVDVGVDDTEVDKICDVGCDMPGGTAGDTEVDVKSDMDNIVGPAADADTEADTRNECSGWGDGGYRQVLQAVGALPDLRECVVHVRPT